jgi:DNA processing protein
MAREILSRVGSEREFFSMAETQLCYLCESRGRIYRQDYRDSLVAKAEAELRFIADNNICTTYFTDKAYPYRLAQCDDSPLMLYTLGNCDLNTARMVGVVGTRHITPYGLEFTNALVDDLARTVDNVVVVSGLAYGVDIAAHRAALKADIPTVAVLAHGLNTIYPADHRKTAADIVHHGGMLLTDYTTADAIHKGNFVARNRIVAGLCDCIIVAESASKGGAMITAEIAAQYNRDVFALPGRSTDRYSAGCNKLIARNTAQLVTSAADVATAMQWPMHQCDDDPQLTLQLELTPDEQTVVDLLTTADSATVSHLTVATGLPIARLMNLLIDMEFKGLLTAMPGGSYRLAATSGR